MFVDGGASPHNNPALQAFLYATLQGYQVGWSRGPEKLLVTSIGTGATHPPVDAWRMAAPHAVTSLRAVLDDSSALVETLMQAVSESPTARKIDVEVGDLEGDLIAEESSCTYLRYNAELRSEWLDEHLGISVSTKKSVSLNQIDDPANMDQLLEIGHKVGERFVREDHFPKAFD